jgi:AcrR family transcriptional regulator
VAARKSADNLKEVIRDFRRDQVIDVARRLFGERGTTEVSMDDIAAEAGVARSTVYVYFSNRDELLRACLKRMLDQLLESIAVDWERDTEPGPRLRTLVEGMFERLDDNPAFFRLALITQEAVTEGSEAVNRGSAAVGSELALIGLEIAGMIQDLYLQGVAAGLFRVMDPDRATSLIGQQIYGAMSVRASELIPIPRSEAAAEVTDFVLRGLSA